MAGILSMFNLGIQVVGMGGRHPLIYILIAIVHLLRTLTYVIQMIKVSTIGTMLPMIQMCVSTGPATPTAAAEYTDTGMGGPQPQTTTGPQMSMPMCRLRPIMARTRFMWEPKPSLAFGPTIRLTRTRKQ